MSKFIRKPVVIEATQWFKDGDHNVVKSEYVPGKGWNYCIHTLEGRMNVSKGDWIVTGVAGENYPVKPHIFDKIYEKV